MTPSEMQRLARGVGAAMLGTIVIGIIATFTVAQGININLSADVVKTAENMLAAETSLRARAYIAALIFGLQVFTSVGLFLLLRQTGQALAYWCLFIGAGASALGLLGAVFTLNAAELAGDAAYGVLASEAQRLLLTGLQASSEYTSFHLALVISTVSMAGFFYLFLKSNMIPKVIAGWGLFASLFVATAIVSRDFVPFMGHSTITMAFMLCNLIALISTGLYLLIRAVRVA